MSKIQQFPRQGEIWLVKFKKSKETPKTFRPCLVISSDIQNEFNDLIAVVPLTTEDIENIEPFEVFVKNTLETGLEHSQQSSVYLPFYHW